MNIPLPPADIATRYDTRLNILHDHLQKIDLDALAATVAHPWFNQTLCKVNDSVVRVGILQGEYHWHKHDDEDEFFFVLEGRFIIDLENGVIDLGPRQGVVIPKSVPHRPRAPERTIVLMVEGAGIVPTGD